MSEKSSQQCINEYREVEEENIISELEDRVA